MNVLGDEVDFVCIHVEMASFRVTLSCFGMVPFHTSGTVTPRNLSGLEISKI